MPVRMSAQHQHDHSNSNIISRPLGTGLDSLDMKACHNAAARNYCKSCSVLPVQSLSACLLTLPVHMLLSRQQRLQQQQLLVLLFRSI